MLPLSRNEKLAPEARRVHDLVKPEWMTQFDDAGAIGRRYRRQDEVGTPFCVTVDFDSLEDRPVTVRDRDTMQQDRIADRRPRRLPAGAPVSDAPEPTLRAARWPSTASRSSPCSRPACCLGSRRASS